MMRLIRVTHGPSGPSFDFSEYEHYLANAGHLLPANAYIFATLDGRRNHLHRQSMHDSWFEKLEIVEVGSGERGRDRSLTARLTLLGAFHDGRAHISYLNVQSYAVASSVDSRQPNGHGNLLVDEVTVGTVGAVKHEIMFESGVLTIECDDIKYEWSAT